MGRHELTTLGVLLLIVAGLWSFAELADEVMEDQTLAFDERVLLAMRDADDPSNPLGPSWVEEMARDFTALGGIGVLTMVTLAAAGFLAMQGKLRAMGFLIAAIVSGVLISSLLKRSFDRPRPTLVPHDSHVYSASFPSGHSMMAAVTWLTLAVLVARVEGGARIKVYLLGVAVFITVAVGVSRVYVGVHWPTDVLAGWTAGTVWAIICWLVARWLQRRGQVEPEPDEDQSS